MLRIAIPLAFLLSCVSSYGQGTLFIDYGNNDYRFFQISFQHNGNYSQVKVCSEESLVNQSAAAAPDPADTTTTKSSPVAATAKQDPCFTSTIPLDTDDYLTFEKLVRAILIHQKGYPDSSNFTEIEQRQLSQIHRRWRDSRVEQLVRALDDDRRAGVIRVTLDPIPLDTGANRLKCFGSQQQQTVQEIHSIFLKSNFNRYLKVDRVSFTLSDNFVYTVFVDGTIVNEKGTHLYTTSLHNNLYELPLRNKSGYLQSITEGDQKLRVCWNNIFSFHPDTLTGAYSTHVRDAEFSLGPGREKILFKRSINDYVGVTVLTDFLGLNDNISPNLLTTGFNAYLPLNTRNRTRAMILGYPLARFLPQMSAALDFTVLNGVNGNSNRLNVLDFRGVDYSNRPGDPIQLPVIDTTFVDYFDLLRYANIRLNVELHILSVQLKAISTNVVLAAGSTFYRTGLRDTIALNGADQVLDFNAYSYAPYFRLLFQYRPDISVGGNLKFDFFKPFNLMRLSNQPPGIFLPSDGLNYANTDGRLYRPLSDKISDRRIFSAEVDLYLVTGNRSGVFSRLGLDWTSPTPGSNVFPRILVGYSTNLDAYISNVRGQSK